MGPRIYQKNRNRKPNNKMTEKYVIFVNKKIKEKYLELETSQEKELYKFINRAIDDLKENPQCGIKISKKLIPSEYSKIPIDNLWKYNLPGAWRLLYTIKGDKIKIFTVLLDWMNHKNYERKFNY